MCWRATMVAGRQGDDGGRGKDLCRLILREIAADCRGDYFLWALAKVRGPSVTIIAMTNHVMVEAVALDTQVFVATGFGFDGKSFQALKQHLANGRLQLVMTEITVDEVKARIRQTVEKELVKQRTFVNEAQALFNSSLAEVQTAITKLDPKVVAKDLCDQFDAFLAETKATVLDVSELTVDNIFEKYFTAAPPFGNKETKKHEFPDAFVIKALGEYAAENELPMFVVSGDHLFHDACSAHSHLLPKGSISEVLDHVASDDEQLAAFVRAETMKRADAIMAEAKKEFEDRFYWVEDEDGDATVEITELTPADEPEILTIDKGSATLQWSLAADYKADLSYDDSATAVYSEGDLMYVEHRDEEVERDVELGVEIEVAYEQMDPESFEILGVSLIDPRKGFGIKTQNNHDWPYK
ncbi:MAG TPA: PIN domain-containing protein [Terracidiphilus sp.]|jgi:predicted nucleic acid-binding protein